MSDITLEIPHVLLNTKKIRKKYQDSQGNTYRVCGFGSYPCDMNGGRSFEAGENFDSDYLSFRSGKTVSECIAEGNEDWRGKTQGLIKARTRRLNRLGVPIFATMTNVIPDVRHDNLDDAFEYLDMLAENECGNGVVLASKEYAKAVRKRYGGRGKNLVQVCSLIMHYFNPSKYQHLFRIYDQVVIKPEHVLTPDGRINKGFFDEIGAENRGRSIVIANHPCQRDCPSLKDHYLRISEMNKSYNLYSGISADRMVCYQSKEMVLDEDQIQQLIEMGVTKFKFGRSRIPIIPISELFPAVEAF
ncbi:MAG: hypothetical protein JXC85_06060 [Candidatus Aenigmarchaeota archaeon]|nr:hypothetical protein [Candidatus Aenigmarchaeota archaeon]